MKQHFALLLVAALMAFTFKSHEYKLDGNELILPVPITFSDSSGSPVLTHESDSALNHIKNYLNDKSYITTLRIEGHTNNNGDKFAQDLSSKKKALLVGRWLVKNGIDCNRLKCVGFGATKPIQSNDTPEGKAANNRITIVNAALRKVPIGGMPLDGGGESAGDPCK